MSGAFPRPYISTHGTPFVKQRIIAKRNTLIKSNVVSRGTGEIPLIWDYALTDMFFLPIRMQKLLLVYYLFSEIALQTKSGKYFQIWFFPRFGGKKWRNSEHAHVSYPGLSFRPPGFSPYIRREERRVEGLDYGYTGGSFKKNYRLLYIEGLWGSVNSIIGNFVGVTTLVLEKLGRFKHLYGKICCYCFSESLTVAI